MSGILTVLRLLRMRQWVKNIFIFFPLVFSGELYKFSLLSYCLTAFGGFCLVASGVYILNDLADIESDRLHPQKCTRPLAQGKIGKKAARAVLIVMIVLGLFLCWRVNNNVFYAALGYVALNLLYNFYTKKVVILDAVSVAVGFQIRIWVGCLAIGVWPSEWLQMCVFLLALFLGFTKRRYEISALKDRAPEHRRVLGNYTEYFLDQIIITCLTLTIVFYGLYAISSDIVKRIGSHNLVYSLIFVIYGVFRYLYLVHVKKTGDDPGEVIFSDLPLMVTILLWIFYIVAALYIFT